MTRVRAVAVAAVGAAVLALVAAARAGQALRASAVRSWTAQAEELGAFAARALAGHGDLLLVERLAREVRRDEVAYALVLDRTGKAVFHGAVADVGKVYDSAYARRALAATATLVQEIPDIGVVEVDVPVGEGMILRTGWTDRGLAPALRWMWAGAGLAALSLVGLGLLTLRAG